MTISKGVFGFAHPDIFGLPYWEFLMWGFYALVTIRILRNHAPPPLRLVPFLFGGALFLVFQFNDPMALTIAAFALLGAMLVYDHSHAALKATAVMIVIGAVVEYVCVINNIWFYPPYYVGGVAYWFAALFGGTGFLCHTLVRPLMERKW